MAKIVLEKHVSSFAEETNLPPSRPAMSVMQENYGQG